MALLERLKPQRRYRQFRYDGVGSDGKRDRGKLQAASKEEAFETLRARGVFLTELNELGAWQLDLSDLLPNADDGPKLSRRDLAVLTQQLHQLLRAGVTLADALTQIAEGVNDSDEQAMLRDISQQLLGGDSPGEAFGRYPRAFGSVFIAYLEAAQASGQLTETTRRLAEALNQSVTTERSVKRVTAYPKLVSGAVGLIVFGVLQFVVPRFETIYDGFDAELPAPTRFVTAAASNLPWVALVLALAAAAVVVWYRRTIDDLDIGERLDKLRFKLPLLGRLIHRQVMYRWSSTFAGALASGVNIAEAAELAARASGSRWLRKSAKRVVAEVESGRPVVGELQAQPELYPPIARGLASTGEQTGSLDEMLEQIAISMREDIADSVATLGARMEVLLILLLGGVVGMMLVALYLPIVQVATTAADSMGF